MNDYAMNLVYTERFITNFEEKKSQFKHLFYMKISLSPHHEISYFMAMFSHKPPFEWKQATYAEPVIINQPKNAFHQIFKATFLTYRSMAIRSHQIFDQRRQNNSSNIKVALDTINSIQTK